MSTKDIPTWEDQYIEENSDGRFELFDEWDHLINTVATKEEAQKIIENYFK